MRQLIQRLYQHGTSGASDAQRVRVQIVNLMSLLGCAISVLFGFGHVALGAPQAFAFNVVAGLAYLAHFPLHVRGYAAAGRRLIAATFLVHIAGLALLFGTATGFHVYLVLGGPIAMLLFTQRDKGWRAGTVAASMLLYIGLEVAAPAAQVVLEPGWGRHLMLLSTVPAIVFVLLVIHGMYLAELHKREASLERAAQTDALTGVPNRRYGFEHAAAAFSHARRSGAPMAVLMLDIDHFKQVNDRHGHAAGDAVLTHVASALVQRLRTEDLLARWGGEEFLIVVATAEPGDAQAVAQALLDRVAGAQVRHESGPLSCTASIGVAVLSPHDGTFEALVARADRALYEAKARGRNCVVVDQVFDVLAVAPPARAAPHVEVRPRGAAAL